MTPPLLSVCLITYKHELYIRQAIESVLSQKVNFTWEFIVAEDCSPDKTRQIVLEYKDKYPDLFRLILQETNVGPFQNVFDLLSAATGKYIAYLEGDDYWIDPLKLQKQVDVLEKNSTLAMATHASYRLMEDQLSLVDSPFQVDTVWSTKDILANDWFIMSASLMVRRSMMDISPAWYSKASNGDLALILLTSLNGNGFYTPDPMSVYRITKTGAMANFTVEDSKKYIVLMDHFNKTSGYKFEKEIAVIKDRSRKDILNQYLEQNRRTNIGSLKYWQNFINALKRAKIRDLFYVVRRTVTDKKLK